MTNNIQSNWRAEVLEPLLQEARHSYWGLLGCKLEQVAEGKVVISMEATGANCNIYGIVHGGVSASLLDMVMGLGGLLARPGETIVTTHLNVQYVAPLRAGKIIASAELLHAAGRSLTFCGRVAATGESGPAALATGTFRTVKFDGTPQGPASVREATSGNAAE